MAALVMLLYGARIIGSLTRVMRANEVEFARQDESHALDRMILPATARAAEICRQHRPAIRTNEIARCRRGLERFAFAEIGNERCARFVLMAIKMNESARHRPRQ